jgi:hypothetical protein
MARLRHERLDQPIHSVSFPAARHRHRSVEWPVAPPAPTETHIILLPQHWRSSRGRARTGNQVHRIHHSVDAEHYNRNFADVLAIFDVAFGTYYRPETEEFPATGLGPDSPAPRSLLSA